MRIKRLPIEGEPTTFLVKLAKESLIQIRKRAKEAGLGVGRFMVESSLRSEILPFDPLLIHTVARAAFWDRVLVLGDKDCWPWKAAAPGEYGNYGSDNAHRMAYLISGGRLEGDHNIVRHKCDNPPCCNPRHLLSGTSQDNADDMVRRQRSRTKVLTEREDALLQSYFTLKSRYPAPRRVPKGAYRELERAHGVCKGVLKSLVALPEKVRDNG